MDIKRYFPTLMCKQTLTEKGMNKMAKHFEAIITITKTVYVRAEDSECPDTIQDYLHGCFESQTGDVNVAFPKELTKENDIDLSRSYSDERFIDHTA